MLRYEIATNEFGLHSLRVTYPNAIPIEIDIMEFYKDKDNTNKLYKLINEYVAVLPEGSQKQIYDIFFEVYNQDDKSNYGEHSYVLKLEDSIAKVAELLDYDLFQSYLISYERNLTVEERNILIPENIGREFIHDRDMNTTQEKTYVRSEYEALLGLIIFIRALSPLYIDYYNYIKQITNHYYYKVFMLFVKSRLYECPETIKLKKYIEANQNTLMGNTKNEHLILSGGLSDDDILDRLISEIVFSKLMPIDFFTQKCNVISFIFQTIRFKGNYVSSDGSTIRSKTTVDNSAKDDISYFEDYRLTSSMPIGTVVEIQHAVTDNNAVINALSITDFDYDKYNYELQFFNHYAEHRIDKTQVYLLGWFISRMINPRALFYIENKRLIEILIMAKVILDMNGHTFVSSLFGSYKSKDTNYLNVILRSSPNKAIFKRLSNHFKFLVEEDKPSVIERTVAEITKEITSTVWVPISAHKQCVNKDGHLDIPNNLTDHVCNYIDFCLNRKVSV